MRDLLLFQKYLDLFHNFITFIPENDLFLFSKSFLFQKVLFL